MLTPQTISADGWFEKAADNHIIIAELWQHHRTNNDPVANDFDGSWFVSISREEAEFPSRHDSQQAMKWACAEFGVVPATGFIPTPNSCGLFTVEVKLEG